VKAKALKGQKFGSDDDIEAMVVQWFDSILCRGNPLADVSLGCLPQCLQGLFLMAFTPSRTIPKNMSFE
jgi:hypothetical protein